MLCSIAKITFRAAVSDASSVACSVAVLYKYTFTQIKKMIILSRLTG
jgi:hypothetical protein